MRKLLFLLALIAMLALSTLSLQGASSKKQMALTRFNEPVLVQGQILKGEYLIVHDDAAMERGEACTYIYKGNAPVREKLVVSFHCVPAARAKVSHFVVRTTEKAPGVTELLDFQFEGETEAHGVPTK